MAKIDWLNIGFNLIALIFTISTLIFVFRGAPNRTILTFAGVSVVFYFLGKKKWI